MHCLRSANVSEIDDNIDACRSVSKDLYKSQREYNAAYWLEVAADTMASQSAENKRLNTQIASMNHAAHAYDGAVERLDVENSDIKRRYDRQIQITRDYIAENGVMRVALEQVAGWSSSEAARNTAKQALERVSTGQDTQSGQEDTQNGNELVYPRQKRDEINGLEIPECLSCGAMSREECSCV